MHNQTIYGLQAVKNLMARYEKKADFIGYTIQGCLVDNYIFIANHCKTAIIKEIYLNEWSSGFTIRLYNKTPKKYLKVMELLDNEETEKATNLFFN